MFYRLSVVKSAFSKNCVNGATKVTAMLGLTVVLLFNGAAFANQAATDSKTDVKVEVNTSKKTSKKTSEKANANQTEVALLEDNKIVFAKVGPNEQVISMSTLQGYRNLHQNLRRRSISLTDRRVSVSSADDSQVSK